MPYKVFAYEPSFYSEYLDFRSDLDKIRMELNKKEVSEVVKAVNKGIESTEQLYYVENGNAHIPIVGSLSNKPNACASMMGVDQTAYSDIIKQTELADLDDTVEKLIYDIDSPGGEVAGVQKTALAIKSASKTTESRVHSLAASAAYWIGSQADSMVAMDETSRVGSIGVVAEFVDTSGKDKAEGIKRVSVTSTDAPDKRIDLTNKEGQSKLRAQLDDFHSVFVETVASGRNTTVEKVNSDFGKGGVLIAKKALSSGMIDGILSEVSYIEPISTEENAQTVNPPVTAQGKNIKQEAKKVDKKTLIAESPELYAEILAQGKQDEQDRLTALDAYAGINSDVDAIIASAKAEGKSKEDVMPFILAKSQSTKEAIDAQEDNAPDLSAISGEQESESDSIDAMIAKAKEIN